MADLDLKALGERADTMIRTLASVSAEPNRLVRKFLTPEHRAAADLITKWMRAAKLARRLDCARDHLTIYALNEATTELLDGPPPTSTERMLRLLSEETALSASVGTYPEKFWQQIADRFTGCQQPIAIAVFTDGENSDESARSKAAIRTLAERLARNPRVLQISFYGVDKEHRQYLRGCFKAFGEDRLKIYGVGDADTSDLLQRIQAARGQ